MNPVHTAPKPLDALSLTCTEGHARLAKTSWGFSGRKPVGFEAKQNQKKAVKDQEKQRR
jgi:hypothetical protein